jgi:hypothetical protein
MAKPVKREPKKPYKRPSLTVYGTVRELTQRNSRAKLRDKPGGGSNRTG